MQAALRAADRHVLWVIGPALGHASRALLVARELRDAHGLKCSFIGADRHGFHARLLSAEFQVTGCDHQSTDPERFADAIVTHVHDQNPAAVCFDCSSVPWLLAMPLLAVPTAYLSNYYLTCGTRSTLQDREWQRHSARWQTMRKSRGLREIQDARALYDCDRVLLADPPQLLPPGLELPGNHRVVGACAWAPEGDLPTDLESLHDLLFVSFGSTGGRDVPAVLVERLGHICGAKHVLRIASGGVQVDGQSVAIGAVPGPAVLARTRLTMTHGGAGSTYQALSQGVPVAVWPGHHNHRLLGERIDELGIGVLLDPTDWMPGLERLARDFDAIASKARRYACDLSVGPSQAAQAIVELL